MANPSQFTKLSENVAAALGRSGRKIVFAESCTAGWLSALLSTVPGISQHLCGSAVVYREETKHSWLDVSSEDLSNPQIGVVSAEVACQMALGVLEKTPEADIAASITGHLGPNAPTHLDGVVFVAVTLRKNQRCHLHQVERFQLESTSPKGQSLRWHRQQQAVALVYEQVLKGLRAFECDSPEIDT